MDYVFVMGSARSGTTEMANLLNAHEQVILGRERFARSKHPTRAHFEDGAFFDPTLEEAYTLHSEWYAEARTKLASGKVTVMGDKVPYYTRVLPWLEQEFLQPRYIYLLRDPRSVANSYERRRQNPDDHWELGCRQALQAWNESIRVACEFVTSSDEGRMLVLVYEWFYSGDTAQLDLVEQFLDLPHDSAVRDRFEVQTRGGVERMARGWPDLADQAEFVMERADWDAADVLRHVAAEQLAASQSVRDQRGWAGPGSLAPSEDVLDATGSALRSRLMG